MAYELINGDCIDVMSKMEDCSVDAIVTDPPYGLSFMGKDWDDPSKMAGQVEWGTPGAHTRGYVDVDMVKFQRWTEAWAKEAFRILKPGGHIISFAGSRTYHRMACAIEDAGFEIRDQIMWLYGTGFPKSLNVSKAIDKAAGRYVDGEVLPSSLKVKGPLGFHMKENTSENPQTDEAKQWSGWGTALKPAHEPCVLARKPLVGTVTENVLEHGTGALNIDDCRIEGPAWSRTGTMGDIRGGNFGSGIEHKKRDDLGKLEKGGSRRWPANIILSHHPECTRVGTLSPAHEPCVLARKPLDGTVTENVLEHGTGALNIDDCRIGTGEDRTSGGESGSAASSVLQDGFHQRRQERPTGGRWPANIILSHNPECTHVGLKTVKGNGHAPALGKGNPFGGNNDTEREERHFNEEVVENWECVEDCPVRILDEQAPSVGNAFSSDRKTDTTGGTGNSWSTSSKNVGDGNGVFDGLSGASKFFYCAKPSKSERNAGLDELEETARSLVGQTHWTNECGDCGRRWPQQESVCLKCGGELVRESRDPPVAKNHHPTVKPVDLMRYLCRLITPPGGVVLDPFMGSGTTGIAATNEGFHFIGIEMEEDYIDIARRRIAHWVEEREVVIREQRAQRSLFDF